MIGADALTAQEEYDRIDQKAVSLFDRRPWQMS